MRILLFVLALALGGCALVECRDVIIGPSQFNYVSGQLIGGNNGGATLLSPDFDKLWDGHPSTDTRFRYDTSGAQTTASFWAVEAFIAEEGSDSPGNVTTGHVAILHTSMPAGAVVEIRKSIATGTTLASGTMQLDQSGTTTSAWLIWDNDLSSDGIFVVLFRNNNGGSTYLSNGMNITIGEIHFSESVEFCMKRTPKISWAQINKQRFTSSGLTLPVMQPQVRTLTMDFAPMTQGDAINNGTTDMETVIYRIMQGNIASFVPFVTKDPAYYGIQTFADDAASQAIRAKTAMLASFNAAPGMGMTGGVYWDTTMNVTESI